MKPIRLLLQAFGPYLEPVELALSSLEADGVFLISGPTGGGKTTLLDAMCFALYCRATGGKRRFSEMRCMSAGMDQPTVVEFDFSLGGETYRFRRSLYMHVNRNTKLPEPRDSHECFRWEESGFQLWESGSESAVRKRAEELLGLTCEQFSQVVVLPQGDFLKLLRASSEEKGKILRTLFSAEIWQDVREKFQERAKKLEGESAQSAALKASLLRQEGVETTEALAEAAQAREKEEAALRLSCEEDRKVLAQTEELLKSAEALERLRSAAQEAAAARKAAQERLSQAQREAPAAGEKRQRAKALREQAVTAAREGERLSQKRQELEKALETARQAQATREALRQEEQRLEALGQQSRELQGRIEKGTSFSARCQEAAGRLPSLLEERQKREKRLAALTGLLQAEQALQAAERESRQKRAASLALARQLEQQEQLLRQNAALELSRTLTPGRPCPVCGSLEHPSPAREAGEVMDQKTLEALREEEKSVKEVSLRAAALVESRERELEQAREALAQLGGPESLEKAETQLREAAIAEDAARKDAERLEAARQKLEALSKEREQRERELGACRESLSALSARTEELERQVEKSGVGSTGPDREGLEKLIRQKKEEYAALEAQAAGLLREAEESAAGLERAKTACSLAQSAAEKAERELESFQAPWESPPELPFLRRRAEALRRESLERSEALGKASASLAAMKAALGSVQELDRQLETLEAAYGRVARLARSLAGNNPLKMPILQYVLSVMLDEVLVSANRLFSTLSRGRYALRLMDAPKGGNARGGLDLEVMDGASMLPRSIETLSGGEQFLASLSLAFGLSDVVQNHSGAVRLDAIFIDEGFGSLDQETLDAAMKALALLQSGGRLIGVISHVSELKSRIPTHIEVSRNAAGFSRAAVKRPG